MRPTRRRTLYPERARQVQLPGRLRTRHLIVAAALVTAGYGAANTAEPANYVLWALIFLSLLCE